MNIPQKFIEALDIVPWSKFSSHIVVAVSGGADSLALVLLLHHYLQNKNITLTALTVDHGLRDSSAKEVGELHTQLTQNGISHHILRWSPKNIKTGLQKKAREARYNLMQNWCKENDINAIFLAHHANDQVETFWLRLMKHSGLDGLSCMDLLRKNNQSGIFFVRPLLQFSKTQLKTLCQYYKQDWFEDPSNETVSFTRNAIRHNIDIFPLNEKDVLRCINCFSTIRQNLFAPVTEAMKDCITLHNEGYITLKATTWKQYHPEIQRRILQNILVAVSGAVYPPRSQNLKRALQKMQSGTDMTSFGCIISHDQNETIICREPIAIPTQKAIKTPFIWDERFKISCPNIPNNVFVAPLGTRGLSFLSKKDKQTHITIYKALPKYVRQTLPVFEKDNEIISIPHINYQKNGINKEINIEFSPKIPIFGTYIKD